MKTHGLQRVGGKIRPEYRAWIAMKMRCYNKNIKEYKNYGGRGIVVCDSWLSSFENFFMDMGERPSRQHSVERIDVNGNYQPSNCKWAINMEQSNNKRTNRFLVYQNKKQTIAQWCRELDLNEDSVNGRLALGWSDEMALSVPIKKKNIIGRDDEVKVYYLAGFSLKEISTVTGINYNTVATKVNKLKL